MALKLQISLSKKIPGPVEFSSKQVSFSIDAELSSGQDPAAEAARLYAQAEAAVDRQLGIAPAPVTSNQQTPSPISMATSSASRPYTRPPRRGAMVTPAQLRLIDQLLRESRTDVGAVLQHFGVASLDQLACKDGSALIDDLKSRATAGANGGRP